MRPYRFFLLTVATLILAVILALLIIAATRGGPSAAERAKARRLQATYLERGVSAFERKQSIAQAKAASVQCISQIGPLVIALDDLKNRLDVGLTYAAYSEKVGDVEVAYNKAVASTFTEGKCLDAGLHAKKARNDYIKAYNTSNNCMKNLMTCNTNSITPSLQAKWALASRQITSMDAIFASIGQPVTPTVPTMGVPELTSEVRASVYGHALADFCGDNAPADAVKPCEDLKTVLSGGVSHGELGAFDNAVVGLNQAYHFAPAKKS